MKGGKPGFYPSLKTAGVPHPVPLDLCVSAGPTGPAAAPQLAARVASFRLRIRVVAHRYDPFGFSKNAFTTINNLVSEGKVIGVERLRVASSDKRSLIRQRAYT